MVSQEDVQRAVVAFARSEACLPAFAAERWLHHHQFEVESDGSELEDSVLRVVATDKVLGQVLPETRDVWLAIAPFSEFAKSLSRDEKISLVQKRRQFLELLVRLATDGELSWNPATMSCGESVGTEQMAKNRFWITLLRELCPDALYDPMMDMERNLIALSRNRCPRFLVCIGSEASASDFMELLNHFLTTTVGTDAAYDSVVSACGLPATTRRQIEVGLSFTKGKISTTIITGLLRVLEAVDSQSLGVECQLQLTTLRFGRECTFQAKALELLGEYPWKDSKIINLRLSGLTEKKPAPFHKCVSNLVHQTSKIQRLIDSSLDNFKAHASAIRLGGSSVHEVDLTFFPTVENAVWLAFAFFHVDSASQVSSLSIRVPHEQSPRDSFLRQEFIDTFKRVLGSVTADHDLADMEGESESQSQSEAPTERRLVKLRPGTPVRSDMFAGARMLCKTAEKPGLEFEVIASVENNLALVVAGVGVGWVPESAVISQRTLPTRIQRGDSEISTNNAVKSLVWDCLMNHTFECYKLQTLEHMNKLVDLLAIIGKPLERLHLPGNIALTSSHLARILEYCPNLQELNVSGNAIPCIQPLVDAYELGVCSISSLSIAWIGPQEIVSTSVSTQLTSILKGPGGKHLRRVLVHLLPPLRTLESDEDYWSSGLDLFCNAINYTSTLEFVQLPYSRSSELKPIDFIPGVHDFATEHMLPLGLYDLAPMSHRAKAAFLSCLGCRGRAAVLSQLDSSVLAQIFRFAFENRERRVIKNANFYLRRCYCPGCRFAEDKHAFGDMFWRTEW